MYSEIEDVKGVVHLVVYPAGHAQKIFIVQNGVPKDHRKL